MSNITKNAWVSLFTFLALAVSGQACAAPLSAYFPYAVCQNVKFPTPSYAFEGSPPIGGIGSTNLKRPPSFVNDNYIWTVANTFFASSPPQSWYDVGDSEFSWELSLYNTSSTDPCSLNIEMYLPSGAKVNTSTTWAYSSSPAPVLLRQNNTRLAWNAQAQAFTLTLAPNEGIILPAYTGSGDSFFTTPASGCSFANTIIVTEPNGNDFLANIRGYNVGANRIGTGNSEAAFNHNRRGIQFNYAYKGDYSTHGQACHAYKDVFNSSGQKLCTIVYLFNPTTSSKSYALWIVTESGTLQSTASIVVPAKSRYTFLPSQYSAQTTGSFMLLGIGGGMVVTIAQVEYVQSGTGTYQPTMRMVQPLY